MRIILFFILVALAIVFPLPMVFGILLFLIAIRSWYFEAALIGLVFDALSGLPFGFYPLFFAALVILTESGKSYLRSDRRLEAVSAVALSAIFFGVLAILFFGAIGGWEAVFSPIFYRDILTDWLFVLITLAVLLAIRAFSERIASGWLAMKFSSVDDV